MNSCVQAKDTFDRFCEQTQTSWQHPVAMVHLRRGMRIRDRIVIGIVNNTLRARLLREKDLILDKAIFMCRSIEITSLHLQKMTVTEEVHYNSSEKKENGKKFVNRISSYCLERHEQRKCPAFGHACSNCHRKNHYEKVCRDAQDTAQREKH